MDVVEVAEAARKDNLRGFLVKHHHTATVDRAYLARKAVPGVDVFGGVTLNYSVGGLNPFAVDAALKMGGKMVWMPSVDAKNHGKHFGDLGKYDSRLDYKSPKFYENIEGITILNEEGEMDPKMAEIMDIVSDHDAAISTSHLSLEESKILVQKARRRKIKVVVTHISFVTSNLSLEDQIWMADKGALLELCYSSISPAWRNVSIDEVAANIRHVGPENFILASDLGQVHNPSPPEGLRIYIMLLLERGIEPKEIRMMVKENPEKLLGID
jgi:hypothetical protein